MELMPPNPAVKGWVWVLFLPPSLQGLMIPVQICAKPWGAHRKLVGVGRNGEPSSRVETEILDSKVLCQQ